MAAKPNDFSFSRPLVRGIPREAVKTIISVGSRSPKPTDALVRLMRGTPNKK